MQSRQQDKRKSRPQTSERIYLVHSDRLYHDQNGFNPDAQIASGRVEFRHKGARLLCDSAYYYQESNSFKAFGHVKMYQGDTLSLFSDYAYYNGNDQMAEARRNVVLRHRNTKLYTDSLNFDRLYGVGYFFEGGKMIDRDNTLVSDWGEYDTGVREAIFYYGVKLKNTKFILDTDTLRYDTRTSLAHIVGPSKITSDKSVIHTSQGYYDTNRDIARLYGRSTLENNGRTITGDSLFHNDKTGVSQGFRNVVYKDTINKNQLNCNYFWYNDSTGFAFATDSAVMQDYSQKDTLYLHSDTMRVYTFNLNTDSVWRRVHCYNKVRAYRTDVQAVCDSLVYSTKDSCMSMYKDPITWNLNRQLLGERIDVYLNDSIIRRADIIGQALSVEQLPDGKNYNQISSKVMHGYFDNGEIRQTDAVGNVLVNYYVQDDKDSSLIGMVYLETDTMRAYMQNRQLSRIWSSKSNGVMYPITQISPQKAKLPTFAWFDYVRPVSKDDIFNWRGKRSGTELKAVKRTAAPQQRISSDGTVTVVKTTDDDSGTADKPAAAKPAAPPSDRK